MNEIKVRQPTEIAQNVDIMGLVDDWRAHLALLVDTGEISDNTRSAYQRGWDKFLSWVMNQDINQVGADDIRGWLRYLKQEKGYRPNTVNAWLAGVRSFFSWAVGSRRLLHNPTEGVRGAKRKGTSKTHKRSVLTNAEIRRVLAQPDRETDQGKRDFAIMTIMAYTAARTIEIHRADLADLETQNDHLVLFVQGKGDEETGDFIVISHPEAENAVYDWLSVRGNSPGPLFTSLSNRAKGGRLSLKSVRRMVKGYYKAAGVQDNGKKTTHSLRHTAITNAVLHGAPVHKVKSMARHASIETTMIYYHEVDRLEDPAEGYIDYNNGNGN